MEKTEFITTLGKLAQKEAKKRSKWVLPSICIAQAAIETGWGKSALMVKANAFFGIKAGSSWKGKVYSTKTKECYDGVSFTTITDCFRAYDSLADSVADYYDLITGSTRYKEAVCVKDAKKCITAIKNGGYATDPNYITLVMSIVKSNSLTVYDTVVTSATTATTTSTASTASTTTKQTNIYVVKKGDTLSEIAQKYNTTVAAILAANKKRYPKMKADFIIVGWKLTI